MRIINAIKSPSIHARIKELYKNHNQSVIKITITYVEVVK